LRIIELIIDLGTIHQRRPIERGASAKVDDLGRGGPQCHKPDVQEKHIFGQKRKLGQKKKLARIFFGCFGSPYWSLTPPLPRNALYFSADRNIFCVSDVFTLDTVRTSEMGVCQTVDVGQVGGSNKSVFARTSFMDDPYDHQEKHYNCNNSKTGTLNRLPEHIIYSYLIVPTSV